MTGRRLAAVLCPVLGVWLATAVLAAKVDVRVDPRRVASDDTVDLTVTVEGQAIGDVNPPSLAGLADWSIINGPAISSQFRYVNGESSTSRSFTWVLAPSSAGRLTIPPLAVEVDGTRLTTAPVQVLVSDPARGGPTPDASEPDATGPARAPAEELFFRTVLDPPDPYVGQQAVLRYDLYTRADVVSVPQAQETPNYPNFWKEDLEGPRRISPRMETIQGREYHVYTVRKVALFATASGETILPPLTFSVPVKSSRSARFRRSFFFDPVETVYKRAPQVTVHVRPLPEKGRPADFANAVGQFRLEAKADRREAETGDAVGLLVSIEGSGNLNSVKEPVMEVPEGFTVYPPETRQSIQPDLDDRFTGVKSWDYILVPHDPGPQHLPAVRFSYFDPRLGVYRTLTAGEQAIEVSGEPLAEPTAGGLPEHRAIERLASDIHFIESGGGALARSRPPLYRTAWFWLGLIVPPLTNLGALSVRWQRRRHAGRIGRIRRRRAGRSALRGLSRAATLMDDPEPQRFYSALARTLTEYVADRFGDHAVGLTYDRIASLLATNPDAERASREFLAVLEACDCARFSPSGGERAREQLQERARSAVLALEEAS
ncbi:MAG: BatD family protein [Acidobacteriota bacterium]